jgi:hypothetical protein
MKLLLENWRKYINESKVTSQSLQTDELFYGTSTALQEILVTEGIPAPSVWGDYTLAERNAYLAVKEHGGELMVINVPISDFDNSKFVVGEGPEMSVTYTEALSLHMEETERGVI